MTRPRRKISIFVFSQQKGHFRDQLAARRPAGPRPRGACARGLLEVRLPTEAGPRGRSAAQRGARGGSRPGDSLRLSAEGARGVTAAPQGPGSEAPALTVRPLPDAPFRVLPPGAPPRASLTKTEKRGRGAGARGRPLGLRSPRWAPRARRRRRACAGPPWSPGRAGTARDGGLSWALHPRHSAGPLVGTAEMSSLPAVHSRGHLGTGSKAPCCENSGRGEL